MDYKPFKQVTCAYHLHYHFCFQTKFNRPIFTSLEHNDFLAEALHSICEQNDCHLLDHKLQTGKLFCLLSLRVNYIISDVARIIKTNLSREFNQRFPELADSCKNRALWSIGYFVRSVGKASRKAVQHYIDNQGQHHGIRDKQSVEIMRWTNPHPANLRAAHVTFDLSYHVVLVTSRRREVFDKIIAPKFFGVLADHSKASGFYIERMNLLSDHIHLLVKLTPSINIEECVLGLMNRSCEFMVNWYASVLKSTGAYNLWTESFYVSTVGDATTAQIKSFLGKKQGTAG